MEKGDDCNRAEYLRHELKVKYRCGWDCAVGRDLEVATRPVRDEYIHFTLGGEAIVVVKKDSVEDLPVDILKTDMDEKQKADVLKIAKLAFLEKKGDTDRAVFIRTEMEAKYGGYWNSIVGGDFVASIWNTSFICFSLGGTKIRVFKK